MVQVPPLHTCASLDWGGDPADIEGAWGVIDLRGYHVCKIALDAVPCCCALQGDFAHPTGLPFDPRSRNAPAIAGRA
jgi:hypothetical protein